jgi:hypothetical protein
MLSMGLPGVVLIDAATFLAAAVLIALIKRPQPATPSAATAVTPISLTAVWREWLEGLRLVAQERMVKILFAFAAITAVGEGILVVLFVPFVTEVLRGQALELGWLMSAQAIGGLLGGFAVAQLGLRINPLALLGPAAILFGLIDLVIFNYPAFFPGITIALVLFILVGVPGAATMASFSTLLQNSVADNYRGRIFATLGTTMALLSLVGMAFASIAGDIAGIVPVINIQGFGYVLAGVLAWLLLSLPYKQIEAASQAPVKP